jgi:hydroxymethylpyrimidine pyrophosphatase-like HAD family hydrolase
MDQLSFRPARPGEPFLLATDLDGTLLGDEADEDWLKTFAQQHAHHFHLAYITGRYRESVLRLVERGRLPRPHYIYSNVGTELFDCNDPLNTMGEHYAAQVGPGWDLEAIYALGEGPGIRRQDFPEGQPRFQAGFFWDADPGTLAAFRARLAAYHSCHIVPAYGEFIDVIPTALGKGNAARFLQQELGLHPDRVVVAGDSGNDRLMFETGFRGILPANVLDELKPAACQPWHYYSPFPTARGVLDGLCHFGFVEQG